MSVCMHKHTCVHPHTYKICLDIIQIKFYLTVLTMSFFSISHYQEAGCHWVCFITSLTASQNGRVSPFTELPSPVTLHSDLHIHPTTFLLWYAFPWAFTMGSTDVVSHVTDTQNSRHLPPDSRRNTISVLLSLHSPFPSDLSVCQLPGALLSAVEWSELGTCPV